MYSGASNFVRNVDNVFLLILGISIFFLLLITVLMIVFIIKYKRKENVPAIQIKDSSWLEFIWTAIPFVLVLLMFYFGWRGYLPMRKVPENATKIKLVGQMWQWTFEYPNGKVSNDLVVPINEPIKLALTSTDVIHGLAIPVFRVKEDVVPGKYNYTWFIPQQIGEYDIFCTAYCGVRHSYMHSFVKVVSKEDYKKMIAQMPDKPKDADNSGLKILQKNACVGCHSLDGTIIVGPTFKGLYGSEIEVNTNGKVRKVKVDDEYLKSSIIDPNLDVVSGFTPGMMKSYKGTLKDDEISKIIEYLKSAK